MRGFSFIHFAVAAIATFAACLTLSPAPVSAGTAAYLSRSGAGTACLLSAPCASMVSAVAAAGSSGEVICLDKGNYGGVNISGSVTISCGDGLWEVPGCSFFINPPAGSDVVIEGLTCDGKGIAGNALNFTGQGTLHLRRVRIGNAPSGGGVAHGLDFTPSGPAALLVSDSIFYNMGSGSSVSAGINIKPASGASAIVAIERSLFEANNFGIIADGTAGGTIRGAVTDSFVTGNRQNGITASTGTTSVVLTIDNTRVSGNLFGLVAGGGATAGMIVRRSVINNNTTGLYTNSGAALYSYRDNSLNGNFGGDGAFTGVVNLQ